ncbi:unnamed protein product [Boreogadus saida]
MEGEVVEGEGVEEVVEGEAKGEGCDYSSISQLASGYSPPPGTEVYNESIPHYPNKRIHSPTGRTGPAGAICSSSASLLIN